MTAKNTLYTGIKKIKEVFNEENGWIEELRL